MHPFRDYPLHVSQDLPTLDLACPVRVQLVGLGEKMRKKRIKLRIAETATKSLVIKMQAYHVNCAKVGFMPHV